MDKYNPERIKKRILALRKNRQNRDIILENCSVDRFFSLNLTKLEKRINYSLMYIDEFIIQLEREINKDYQSTKNGRKMKSNLVKITKFHNIRNTILDLNDIYTKRNSIVAKANRSKRKPKPEDPNISSARILAKQIWGKYSKKQLLDTAYEIKSELGIRKSVGLIQEWIRDLNPNRKKN
ncbi:TPA: hypothetical protein ACX3BP_000529 [Pasteurella multocida]